MAIFSEEELNSLRQVVYSDGWTKIIRPALLKRGSEAMKSLLLSRAERSKKYAGSEFDTEDDVLRAMVRNVEWLAAAFSNEVLIAEHNRRLDELQRRGAEEGSEPR